MLGIEESATRTARTRRLLVLDPARRNLGIDPLLLTPGEHVIGSGPDASIRLTAAGIAPRHCVVRVDGNHTTVTAFDRRTWHNNGPFAEARLRLGDKLAVGPIEFRIGELAEAPERPEDCEAPARRESLEQPAKRRAAETRQAAAAPAPAPQQALELEAQIQERLLAASQLVDDLLREERGGAPAALALQDRDASPRDRGEFVLKLLDTLHERASALVERERRVTAAQREFETERRQIDSERESLARKQTELTDAREALTRAQEELQHQRNTLESQHYRLENDTRNTSDRLREIEVALESLRAEEARFEESRSSHREAVLGLETELQERCNRCVETEKRLAAERAALDAELEKLDIARARCEAVRKELEEGDAQLEAVAIELEQRTTELRRKSDALDQAAAELARRTTTLDETEQALEERLTALGSRESELERRESELLRREDELTTPTTESAPAPSEALACELASIAEQREELGEIWVLLDRGLRGLVDSRREVEALRITLTETQHVAEARSEQHAAQLKQIEEQRAELEARKAHLAAEQHRLEEREARLTASAAAAAPESHAAEREEIEQAWQWIQSETWRLIEEDQRLHCEADRLRCEEEIASDRHGQDEQLKGALARAEIELAGWEAQLEETVAHLDDRRAELDSSERSLAERVEEHNRKVEAFNEAALVLARHEQVQQKQRIELERREAALNEGSARLADERVALSNRIQECEERAAFVAEREQQAEQRAAEQAQLAERLADLSRESARLDEERADFRTRLQEIQERESLLAAREQDLAAAREHFEVDRADLLDARTRTADEAASAVAPHEPAPALRSAHAFDEMPSFFPTPSLPMASEGFAPHEPETERAREIKDAAPLARHDEEPAGEQPLSAAQEFRLLDLAWFSGKSGPRDEVAADAGDEPALDETSRLGQPCLRPDDSFGSRPSSDDDRVAAFWRTTNEQTALAADDEEEDRPSHASSEPSDERASDLRSALAAMFDLPSDLASRRAAQKDDRDEPVEASARLEEESHDAPADNEAAEEIDEVPSPIDFGRLLESAVELERRPEPEVRRELEPPIHRPMASEAFEARTERPASHGSAVHDIEDSDSVAAYMERLFARTRRESEVVYEQPRPAAPAAPEPDAAPPRRSPSEIVVPAYVPGMEAPPEEPVEEPADVDPVHRQDKDAVRARMDSLREMANISARSAIAKHSWKQFRTVVWVKVLLLLGAAAMAVCLLSDRLFGKVGLKFAGWSLAGIAMVVAANLAHTVWTLYRGERTGEWPETEPAQPTVDEPKQA